MRVGIASFFGYVMEPKYKYELIKEYGFESVIILWSDDFKNDNGPKEQLAREAKEAGLVIDSFHAPWIGSNELWTDNYDSKIALDNYKKCIEACYEYEVKKLVMHVTYGHNPPPYSQTGVDNIKRLLEHAEKYNVDLAYENVRETNYLEHLFEDINSDRLKLCYDSGHANCYAMTSVFEKYPEKIVTTHMHDNDGSGDQHLMPFEGTIDWSEVTNMLKYAKYSGDIMIEAHSLPAHYSSFNERDFLKMAYENGSKIAEMSDSLFEKETRIDLQER